MLLLRPRSAGHDELVFAYPHRWLRQLVSLVLLAVTVLIALDELRVAWFPAVFALIALTRPLELRLSPSDLTIVRTFWARRLAVDSLLAVSFELDEHAKTFLKLMTTDFKEHTVRCPRDSRTNPAFATFVTTLTERSGAIAVTEHEVVPDAPANTVFDTAEVAEAAAHPARPWGTFTHEALSIQQGLITYTCNDTLLAPPWAHIAFALLALNPLLGYTVAAGPPLLLPMVVVGLIAGWLLVHRDALFSVRIMTKKVTIRRRFAPRMFDVETLEITWDGNGWLARSDDKAFRRFPVPRRAMASPKFATLVELLNRECPMVDLAPPTGGTGPLATSGRGF
ncbi:MAG: hypothetical protein JWM47_3044 [Acidimicrobiales bacterium]|nr:hypothetical protein [Acidimicrobiales bacterium]